MIRLESAHLCAPVPSRQLRGREPSVKISTEQREPREAVLTVELDNADIEPYLDQAYRQAVRRLSIPGFRKGKAPRRIVEQMFGRGYLLNEALDTVIQEFTSKAVQEEGLDIGGIPSVSLDELDPPQFTATVPLQPLVDLGNLDTVRHPKEEADLPDERVDATLEQMRMELAVWEPADDAVQMDDLINLTITGWVEEDGERREIVHSEETDYIPRPGSTFPVPGLDEGLVGLMVGEQRTFDVDVPEDAANAEAAGKTAHFEATVHSVKRRSLPELDDEFAKSVGDDYESLEALREKMRENLLEREKRLADIRHQDETLAKVTEDKERESQDGFDGSWIAHPDLVPVAKPVFEQALGDRPHQKDKSPTVTVEGRELIDLRVPNGQITEAGIRNNVSVAVQYLSAWLSGNGAVGINNLMEDAATAEISRSQLWQWIHNSATTDDGRTVDLSLYETIRDEELAKLGGPAGGRLGDAVDLLDALVSSPTLDAFLTVGAYERLD